MLVTPAQFAEQCFAPGSRPKVSKIWRWIRDGRIPAVKIGRQYWLDPDEVFKALRASNPLIDRVLA